MLRLTLMSGVWYGMEVEDVRSDAANIQSLVNDGIPVVLVDDDHGAQELGIGDYVPVPASNNALSGGSPSAPGRG